MLGSQLHAVFYAVLTNDHKAVMLSIEQLMHELHAEMKNGSPSPQQGSTNRPQPAVNHAQIPASSSAALPQLPFAVVDEVSSMSPAEEAGIMVGDQLVSFASVTKHTPNTLPAVAAALQVIALCKTASPRQVMFHSCAAVMLDIEVILSNVIPCDRLCFIPIIHT